MELIYTNQDYGNQIKQANQAISDLSVYEFEKYFKQLKKIKRVATLKSHRAAIVHALKITHKKRLIESEKFLELIEFLEEFKTGKVALGIQEKNKMETFTEYEFYLFLRRYTNCTKEECKQIAKEYINRKS